MEAARGRGAWRLPVTLLLAATAAAGLAGTAVAEGVRLNGGAEIDEEGGYWLSAGVSGAPGGAFRWHLGAARSELEDNLSGLSTTSLDGSVGRRFGKLAIDLTARWWEESDLVAARAVGGALGWEGEHGFAALRAERRQSDFEPFRVATIIELRGGNTLPVTAVADCDLDDTGTGGEAGWFGQGWYLMADAMWYDYDNASCGFDSPVLDALRDAERRVFVQLAGRATADLSQAAGFRIRTENAFLDHRYGIGGGIERIDRSYWVRYDQAEEIFAGLESQTLTLGADFYREDGGSFGVYLGISDGDAFDTIAFLGVSVELSL